MSITIDSQRMYQYTAPQSHIVTDSEETIKLLQKKCSYVKPWSMDNSTELPDKSKQALPKDYRKIDFLL